MTKNELTKTQPGGAVAVSSALQAQLASLKTTGFENVGADDVAMPVLRLLQDLSPEVDKKKKDAYIPGAESGHIINRATQELYEGFNFVAVDFHKNYIEYVPRTAGGGYVATHTPSSPLLLECEQRGAKLIAPNGNELVETANFIGVVIPDEGKPFIAMLPLQASMVSVSKRFLSLARKMTTQIGDEVIPLPLHAQLYRVGTQVATNRNNQSWYVYDFDFIGTPPDEVLPLIEQSVKAKEVLQTKMTAAYAQDAPEGHARTSAAVMETME